MDLLGYFQPKTTRKNIGLRKGYAAVLIITNLIVYVFSLLKTPYCCQNSKVSISVDWVSLGVCHKKIGTCIHKGQLIS